LKLGRFALALAGIFWEGGEGLAGKPIAPCIDHAGREARPIKQNFRKNWLARLNSFGCLSAISAMFDFRGGSIFPGFRDTADQKQQKNRSP